MKPNMTLFVRGLVLVILAWQILAAAPSQAEPPRPNIVLIFVDDQGYGDLGCYGARDIKTPHIDQLANEGTRFTSFYVAQPVCTASRTALLTGCYPNRLSMAGALNHTSVVGIHPQEILLSDLCKQQGYATAVYGKWHLGHHPPFLPTRRGFDEFYGIPYSNDNGPLHPVTAGIPPLPLYENQNVVACDPDQSQFTRKITERAVGFIDANKDRPFFLYVPHIMPHVPIFASEKFRGASERGLYGDVIQELDWSVGEILAALDKNRLGERTLVIYASDNGPFLSYGEHAGSAGVMREGKLTTFEGGVRVPGIMRWPGRIPENRVCSDLVTTMDLFATLTNLVGAKPPARKTDGVDVAPLIFGEKGAKGRDIFWYYSGDELHAVRQGDWKLHLPHEYLTVAAEPGVKGKPSNFGKLKPESIELSGIRGIATRHGYRFEKIGLSLYNLADDPGETNNLAQKYPNVVQRLQAIADAARADLGDSLTKTLGPNVRPSGDVRSRLPDGVRRLSNLEYSNPDGKRSILLDLYLPERKPQKPLPVVVWIHGGGWKAGSKENCPLIWLAGEGFAVASIDYRLAWETKWPAQIDDCRVAIRWLRTNAKQYDLDSDHIAAAGGSAGGHLAALVGTLDSPRGESISSRVQAVCDSYGPSDLLSMPLNVPSAGKTDADLAKSNGALLLGGIVRDLPDLARQASAIYQVSKDDPPFLILHGDQDPQVPLVQSEKLHEKLIAAGVPSTLHVVEGAGHGGKAFDAPEIRKLVREFLGKSLLTLAASGVESDDDGFALLLAGNDTAGWVEEQHEFFRAKHPEVKTWSVRNGVASCDGSLGNCGFLRYDRKLCDFVLRLEYRMSAKCNSGIGLRAAVPYTTLKPNTLPSNVGYEFQIMDDAGSPASATSTGSFYGKLAPSANAARPVGEWNTLEIECRGPQLRATLNGQVVQNIDQRQVPALTERPQCGYLSLQNHGHDVEFRRIRLKELGK
jgi:arylsulfatase A-like enzyme/acetyl esterase/lipase